MSILFSALSLGGMGLIFGLGLGYAGIKFKVEEDPKLELVREALPGVNCGGCGYAGCDAFAKAVVLGQVNANACGVGGTSTVQKVAEILGVEAEVKQREVAYIKCDGNLSKSVFRYEYFGLKSCLAATHLAGGGPKACIFGCLGCGSCIEKCDFNAINVEDGIALIDKEKCVACKKCVESCPRKLIEIIPYSAKIKVACSSTENAKGVRESCTIGCVGCKLCQKACRYDAIHIKSLCAKIDYNKCTACGECISKCIMGCIVSE